jgi:hypothetical protein
MREVRTSCMIFGRRVRDDHERRPRATTTSDDVRVAFGE